MLRGFVLPVLEYCSAVWCSAAKTHHKLLDRVVSCASFFNWGVLACNVAVQCCSALSLAVLCILYKIRFDRCTPLFIVIYLCHMCQYELHAVLWYIDILMRLLSAEPRRTAGLLFTSKYLCKRILLTLYSMVLDFRILRAEPINLMPSMVKSHSVENLLPLNMRSIINYLQ